MKLPTLAAMFTAALPMGVFAQDAETPSQNEICIPLGATAEFCIAPDANPIHHTVDPVHGQLYSFDGRLDQGSGSIDSCRIVVDEQRTPRDLQCRMVDPVLTADNPCIDTPRGGTFCAAAGAESHQTMQDIRGEVYFWPGTLEENGVTNPRCILRQFVDQGALDMDCQPL